MSEGRCAKSETCQERGGKEQARAMGGRIEIPKEAPNPNSQNMLETFSVLVLGISLELGPWDLGF